jgi:methylated-DNA-protein-cysteine methyltransferase-like protein
MTELQRKVIDVVRRIPTGKVMSYGQVARAIGVPRGAQMVGWVLKSLGEDCSCPWWRVTNNEGKISIKGNSSHGPLEQRRLLMQEGVAFTEFGFEIERYRWDN